MPPKSAPKRQHVLTFATPKVKDILFYETEKTTQGKFGRYGKKIPEYGTKHYDTTNWPNHELIFVQPDQEDGQYLRFYYAAERDSQDDYNYDLRNGQELIRTYVVKREDYDDSTIPTTDATLFTIPDGGTVDTQFGSYKFAGDSIINLGEPLSSVYIGIQRRYLQAPTTDEIFDPSLEETIDVTKDIVPITYTLAGAGLSNSAGLNYAVQNGNRYHKILVTRELPTKTDRQLDTLYGAQKYEFPARLDSADMIYRAAWVTRSTAAGTTAQFSEDFYIDFDVTPPKDGPFKTKIERWITAAPETLIDTILSGANLIPKPAVEEVSVAYAAYSSSPAMARAVARQYRVPPSFHGSVNVTVNGFSNTGGVGYTINRSITPDPIPASPTGFTGDLSGTYLIDVDVTKVALDMFLVTAVSLVLNNNVYS